MKRACLLLADGFEEVEAVTPIDYMRRAGVEVLVVALAGGKATGSHGLELRADADLEAVAEARFDAIVIPGGGKGADNIAANRLARDLIRRHFFEGMIVAAICAAPAVVLHEACGLLAGRRFTGFPGTESKVIGNPQAIGATFVTDRVVADGNLITSRAAGTAGEFAYALVNALEGENAADMLAEKILLG